MADPFTDLINGLVNGNTLGIPNLLFLIIIGIVAYMVYNEVTKKPGIKEFKPMDMRKETKKRIQKEYKPFGEPIGTNIYDSGEIEYAKQKHIKPRPLAFVIGWMKIIENKQFKRFEPIYSKITPDQYAAMHETLAKRIYNKEYAFLDSKEKKEVDSASKDEIRHLTSEVEDMKQKIVRGKKENIVIENVPLFALKVCNPDLFSKLIARYLGFGADWWVLNADQLVIEDDVISFAANYQRRYFNGLFVYSKEAKKWAEDFTFVVERENSLQEDANFLPRLVHYEGETAKIIAQKREDFRLLNEKNKSQKE